MPGASTLTRTTRWEKAARRNENSILYRFPVEILYLVMESMDPDTVHVLRRTSRRFAILFGSSPFDCLRLVRDTNLDTNLFSRLDYGPGRFKQNLQAAKGKVQNFRTNGDLPYSWTHLDCQCEAPLVRINTLYDLSDMLRRGMRNALQRDLYCLPCRGMLVYHDKYWSSVYERIGHRPAQLWCDACHDSHPMRYFSRQQRRAAGRNTSRGWRWDGFHPWSNNHKRAPRLRCIGWEGKVRLCSHVAVSWPQVLSSLKDMRQTGDDVLTVACSHADHREGSGGNITFTPEWELRHYPEGPDSRGIVGPKKMTGEVTLTLRWTQQRYELDLRNPNTIEVKARDGDTKDLIKFLASSRKLFNQCPAMLGRFEDDDQVRTFRYRVRRPETANTDAPERRMREGETEVDVDWGQRMASTFQFIPGDAEQLLLRQHVVGATESHYPRDESVSPNINAEGSTLRLGLQLHPGGSSHRVGVHVEFEKCLALGADIDKSGARVAWMESLDRASLPKEGRHDILCMARGCRREAVLHAVGCREGKCSWDCRKWATGDDW